MITALLRDKIIQVLDICFCLDFSFGALLETIVFYSVWLFNNSGIGLTACKNDISYQVKMRQSTYQA